MNTQRSQLTEKLLKLTRGRFFTITWRKMDGSIRVMHAQSVRLATYANAPRPKDGQMWLRDLAAPKGRQLRTVVLDRVMVVKCGEIRFDVRNLVKQSPRVRVRVAV